MDTLVVTGAQINALIERVGVDDLMLRMVEELTAACNTFDSKIQQVRQRDGFHYHVPHLGLLEWMPCMSLGRQVSVKMVAYHPENPSAQGLPTILSTVQLFDPNNGHLTGLIDGTYLTALRTGAASCVASRVLARSDSSTVGIIGCGAQAVTQLHGLCLHFDITEVLIHDVSASALESFHLRVAPFINPVVKIRTAPVDTIVQSSDILITATSQAPGEPPLFGDLPTQPWLHVNAVGSDFTGKVELPLQLLSRSLVCPDDRPQALLEGECQRLTPDQVGPELWELIQTQDKFLEHRNSLTVFDSTGWSLEDQVAANLIVQLAEEHGLCERIAIERVTRDPLNPYDTVMRGPVAAKPKKPRAIQGRS